MSTLSLLMTLLTAAIPLSLAIAAVVAGLGGRFSSLREDVRWSFAWGATLLVSLLTVILAAWVSIQAVSSASNGLLGQAPGTEPMLWLSLDPLRLILLALLSVMGMVVVKYSRRFLANDPGFGRYLRWLLLTLAAVALVFVSDNLVLFALGWISISLSLHQLLMFFPDRPRAALAAHKKFLLARVAETSLVAAFVLLWHYHDSASIREIVAIYRGPVELSWQEQLAAIFIAVTALIKCAQLPVHGWLMQVVEAPTPVSALLHAGVINLGGLLLILFAPLILQAAAAQWLVLIVAGLTTVLAALIMSTRVSIKVRLAWSTSAQMGLMLLECALGLIELALLHLLAHSAYKAYAFLTAGSEVHQYIHRSMVNLQEPEAWHWWSALPPALLLTATGWYVSDFWHAAYQPVSAWLLLALALTALIAMRGAVVGLLSSVALATLMAAVYVLLKTLLVPVVGRLDPAVAPGLLGPADIWGLVLFAALFALWWALRWRPQWPWVQSLSVALFAGLYLDEWFTRTTLRLWPAHLPQRANPKRSYLSAAREEKAL